MNSPNAKGGQPTEGLPRGSPTRSPAWSTTSEMARRTSSSANDVPVFEFEALSSLSKVANATRAAWSPKKMMEPGSLSFHAMSRFLVDSGRASYLAVQLKVHQYQQRSHAQRVHMAQEMWMELFPPDSSIEMPEDLHMPDHNLLAPRRQSPPPAPKVGTLVPDEAQRRRSSVRAERENFGTWFSRMHVDRMAHISSNLKKAPRDLWQPVLKSLEYFMHALQAEFFASRHFELLVQSTAYQATRDVGLDRLRVVHTIDRGSFGKVCAVQMLDTKARYAMKSMDKHMIKRKRCYFMPLGERDILSRVQSPFVLSLAYSFHDEDNLYLLFQLLTGGTLAEHIMADNMQRSQARFTMGEVLLGLEHLHANGVVYRDLKPLNLMLDDKGHCVITDLGLAARLEPDTTSTVGTPGYWAPEVVDKSAPTSTASDLWSYGVVLHELLTGRRPQCRCQEGEWCPFGDESSKAFFTRARDPSTVLEVRLGLQDVAEDVADLIRQLLQPDPSNRLGASSLEELKQHPFFAPLDWEALEARELPPPFVPSALVHRAQSPKHTKKYRASKSTPKSSKSSKSSNNSLASDGDDEEDEYYANFTFKHHAAEQAEMVAAFEKLDVIFVLAPDTSLCCCSCAVL